jgi:hypothetical protein
MMCELTVPMLLLSFAAGYGVLVLANKQERPLDKLGRLSGGLIVLVSLVGLLCTAVCEIGRMTGHGPAGVMCAYSGHGGLLGSRSNPATSPVSDASSPSQ